MRKEAPEPGTEETEDQESIWLAHPFHPLLEKITEMELKEESLDDNRKYSKYYRYELMIKVVSDGTFIVDEAPELVAVIHVAATSLTSFAAKLLLLQLC